MLSLMQAHGVKRVERHTTGLCLRNNVPSAEIAHQGATPMSSLLGTSRSGHERREHTLEHGRAGDGCPPAHTSLMRP